MIKKKGQPISGSGMVKSSKSPIVPNAADTSANEQTMIKEAPSPFKNNQQVPQIPAASRASGGISTLEPRIKSGLAHSSPGARALPQRGPIGQNKPISMSGAVNGRMGTSFPRKVGGSDLVSKYPRKGNAKFYGE